MDDTVLNSFRLLSPVFKDGSNIPVQYTCKGQNINPPLNIFNVPQTAQSLALMMHDPDAISGDFTHWLMWNIAPEIETIAVNSVPEGVIEGLNTSGKAGYMGPCPPAGTGIHHYIFELYALRSPLNLSAQTTRKELEVALKDRGISSCKLTGLFGG
ncbi:MAG: YbhB/YbcL family Raf kinase inhibitor-like protein [Candidatus Saccharimonadales bacterium]